MNKVLNVGGNNKAIPIPKCYDGWEHHLLDIDPKGGPDVLCDAQELYLREDLFDKYDSVYCSHNLEHYYQHKVASVLQGFFNVTNGDGFVYVAVPHIPNVLRQVVASNMELTDPLYRLSDGTPISAHDVIYGWGKQIRESGVEFFAHKTAFSPQSLYNAIRAAGFEFIYISEQGLNLVAYGFKKEPTEQELDAVTKG